MHKHFRYNAQWWNIASHWRSLFVAYPETAVLDGWRGLSMLLVFIFHLFFTVQEFVTPEGFQFFYHATHWALLWVWAGDRGVDIFFVLSGFLIGASLLKQWRLTGEVAARSFWYRRILRLAPVYYLILLLYWLASGPNADNIWANFLYINNYLSYEQGAMLWSWSLAIEMQFYLLLPLLLAAGFFRLRPSTRWLLMSIVLLLAIAFRAHILYADERLVSAEPWQFLLDKPTFKHFFTVFYDNFETRFGSLLIGFMAAYVLAFHSEASRLFWARWYGVLCVLLALMLVLMLTVLPGVVYRVTDDDTKAAFGGQWQLIYLIGHRYVYSAAIAVLMLYSLQGGGIARVLQVFLACRLWVPLARLSYSIYLIHIMVIFAVYKLTLPVQSYGYIDYEDFSGFRFVWLALLSGGITLVVALFLYLFIERPFMQLRR